MGPFGMSSTDDNLQIKQPVSQFFASQLINLEWLLPGDGVHKLYSAESDIHDTAGNSLVTAYAAARPAGTWSLLVINKDQENAQTVHISFVDDSKHPRQEFSAPVSAKTFGKAQYVWHPDPTRGTADPDGPIAVSTVTATPGTSFTLPAPSTTVFPENIKALTT